MWQSHGQKCSSMQVEEVRGNTKMLFKKIKQAASINLKCENKVHKGINFDFL